MAINETRRLCFNLNGLMGGVIATLLLLAILVYLTINAISVQQNNAENFYQLKDESTIQFKSTDNAAKRVIVGEK